MLWQPIGTAPMDGRKCLLYWPKLGYMAPDIGIGYWDDNRFSRKPQPYWESTSRPQGRTRAREHPPKHWMPLPAPPTE